MEQVASLEALPEVRNFIGSAARIMQHMESLAYEQAYALLCLPAIGQRHVLQALPHGEQTFLAGCWQCRFHAKSCKPLACMLLI